MKKLKLLVILTTRLFVLSNVIGIQDIRDTQGDHESVTEQILNFVKV